MREGGDFRIRGRGLSREQEQQEQSNIIALELLSQPESSDNNPQP